MSFLYLKDGEVLPTEEGNMLPQVRSIFNADKTENKRFYKDVLMYVFFVYKQDGVYKDMFERQRKKTVIDRHLPKREWEDLEKNKRVLELIREYLDRQMTKTERMIYELGRDMERLIERVYSIPYTKIGKMKVNHKNDDGDIDVVVVEVEIDNSKEKSEAYKIAEQYIDYEEKLKTKLGKEKMEQRKSDVTRLFDKKMN